jgi:calcium/calmodulin-dependent protein kinase (CaM kinase) II
LTAFEPEACGHLVEGLGFHRYYFELERSHPVRTTISSPHVRLLGDTAVVCYIRLMQLMDGNSPQTRQFEETRIWRRDGDSWRHVHFHRSDNR